MAEDPRAIRLDEFVAHPPAKVWRALTEPELMARWLMPNDFRLEVGHRFTFTTEPKKAVGFDGIVHCEVLEFEAEAAADQLERPQGGRLDGHLAAGAGGPGHQGLPRPRGLRP